MYHNKKIIITFLLLQFYICFSLPLRIISLIQRDCLIFSYYFLKIKLLTDQKVGIFFSTQQSIIKVDNKLMINSAFLIFIRNISLFSNRGISKILKRTHYWRLLKSPLFPVNSSIPWTDRVPAPDLRTAATRGFYSDLSV